MARSRVARRRIDPARHAGHVQLPLALLWPGDEARLVLLPPVEHTPDPTPLASVIELRARRAA